MAYKNVSYLASEKQMYRSVSERGFVLFSALFIVIIVGLIAVSKLRSSELSEVLAGNSIQRSRAFQGAQGGLIEAERNATVMAQRRIFASPEATDGVFSRSSVGDYWWREEDYNGSQVVNDDNYPGVVSPPVYVMEEIGSYESDGGSGIVNLDRGGGRYGLRTDSGRQLVLYRMQAKGLGSTDQSQALVESLFAQSQ